MYLSKRIKNLMDEFDFEKRLPQRFDLYIKKITTRHKLIIKSKYGYHCDNCGCNFQKKKITRIKYGEKWIKCPQCKNILITKSNRIKKYTQNDNFCIIETFKDKIIYRLFAVKTDYNNGIYKSHTCEYGRQLFDNQFHYICEIYNNNISATISGKYINHKSFLNYDWKKNGSYYYSLGDTYMLYPYNLKKIFKATKWQYSQLWEFAKHIDYFNVCNFMSSSNIDMLEHLIKNKLYILTDDLLNNTSRGYCIKLDYKFIKKHLEFIRKYKLNIDEIEIMKFFNISDIKLIRKYSSYADNLINILKELNIKLELVDKYVKDAKDAFCEYIDYLQFCRILEYDIKDKKILYPPNAEEAHERVMQIHNNLKNKMYQKQIKKRYEQIKSNIYQNNIYIVFPVKNQKELINESKQQNNCVKTYAERIAKGDCDIYFMRELSDPKISLVTIEVRNNKVVQKRTKNNCETTPEQNSFIKLWEMKVLNGKERTIA